MYLRIRAQGAIGLGSHGDCPAARSGASGLARLGPQLHHRGAAHRLGRASTAGRKTDGARDAAEVSLTRFAPGDGRTAWKDRLPRYHLSASPGPGERTTPVSPGVLNPGTHLASTSRRGPRWVSGRSWSRSFDSPLGGIPTDGGV